jgi:nitrate reductase gamma subunit
MAPMGGSLALIPMDSTMESMIQALVGAMGGLCLLYGFLALVERRRQHRERRQQWERYASWRHRR